jgi:hypothetical protein
VACMVISGFRYEYGEKIVTPAASVMPRDSTGTRMLVLRLREHMPETHVIPPMQHSGSFFMVIR